MWLRDDIVDAGAVEDRLARNKSGTLKENPMPLVYGPGPADKKCRDCKHLQRLRMSQSWFKCDLRRNTSSTYTDHRALWPTCGKFEAAE